MRLHTKTTQFILAAFLFCATFAGFGQDQTASQPKPDASVLSNQPVKDGPVKNDSHCVVQEGNPGTPTDTQCVPSGTSVVIINQPARRDMEEAAAYRWTISPIAFHVHAPALENNCRLAWRFRHIAGGTW
jgi:hypothetical protein